TGGNIVAGQGLYESGGAVRVYSSNNPPPSTTFDGGDWWQDNSSGWIIQTGIVNRADYSTGVTFPRAFPNQCKGVFLTLCNTVGRLSDSGDNIRAMNVSNTGFVYGANGTPEQTSFYVAFGR
ncbi:gp53-like domain-containing protein, partial [Enterobacter asburiae]|uniref:gp53-like domain-containing protein n=1 Tax=Enterobacter asburiae TaxID=61645 RepID=UPI003BC81BC8